MNRFLHLVLGFGLLLVFPACDSDSSEDPDGSGNGGASGFLCSVPSGISLGTFAAEIEERGETETRRGTAVHGFVEHDGTTYFVIQLDPGDRMNVVSLYEPRASIFGEGTTSIGAFGPLVGFVESGSRTFGGPGQLTLTTATDEFLVGTFEFGFLTEDGDTDTASACGSFRSTFDDDIDPDEIAGLF